MPVSFGSIVVEVPRDTDLSLISIVPKRLQLAFEKARQSTSVNNQSLGPVVDRRRYSITLDASRAVLRISPLQGERLSWKAVHKFEEQLRLDDISLIFKPEGASDKAVQAQIEKNIAKKMRWSAGIHP